MTDATAAIAAAYDAAERRRRTYTGLGLTLACLSIVGGMRIAEDANSGTFWGGLAKLGDYPAAILSDAWGAGWSWFGLLAKYFPFLIETINIALLSTLIGFLFGACFSVIASRNLVRNRAVIWTARRALDIARAFPEIVIALFLIYIVGSNAIVAVAAVAFHTIGALGKQFSEVTENADMKPWEGIEAAGGTWLQKVWFGILPQVMPNWLSYALLRLEINVRASAIVGFVGAGGLGGELKVVIDWNHGDDISAIMALLIASIIAIDAGSGSLRRRLIGVGGR